MKFSADVRALNLDVTRDLRRAAQRHEDVADVLLAELARLAPDLPSPERDRPFQRFKIDLAWPAARLAVEVNGGLRRAGGGKHATSRDHQKVRQLVLDGWHVLVFTSSEVRCDPLMCIRDISTALALWSPA